MNNFRALVIILTIAAIAKSDDSSCLYEFESDSEMEDFDSTCDGLKGEWKIEDVPDNIPIPSGHGSKGLTIKQQSNGCLQSSKKLTLNTTTKVICSFYWNKAQSGSVNFKIKFVEDSTDKAGGNEWDIAKIYDNQIGEHWFEASYDFTFPEIQNYKLQIMLYLNSASVLIDRIRILDIVSNSDQCYLHPRTTTELTTTTTAEILTTTTTIEDTTTTTEFTTTTTEEIKTTTIKATTTTTEEITTTTEEVTSITTESTDLPETSTSTAATTHNSEPITTDSTEVFNQTTTFLDVTTTTTFNLSTDTPDIRTTASSTGSETIPANFGGQVPDPNLILFPILIIVSLTILLCLCSFCILLRRKRRKSKTNFKNVLSSSATEPPMAFHGKPKTDDELYYQIAREWKASSQTQHRLKK